MVGAFGGGFPVSFATLMVHLDLDHTNDARLSIAADLAERLDAGVIGIAACSEVLPYYADGFVSGMLVDENRIEIQKRIDSAEERFRSALNGRAKQIEWRSALTQPTFYVAEQARAADLVIVGANRAADALDPLRQLDPSDLVTMAGRPILIVPQGVGEMKAERILVAWKDTREARRAIWDALPLLRKCEKAIVAEIDENNDPSAAQSRVDDVVAWLAGHGVKAFGTVPPSVQEAAIQLETLAWEEGADLIVAGAYGHSRFREWVLGGVTRDLITKTPRCSLLAH